MKLTDHLLHPLTRFFSPEQEPTASLEEKSGALDVRAGEIVDEGLVNVKDGVGLSDLELGELAVIADILRQIGVRERKTKASVEASGENTRRGDMAHLRPNLSQLLNKLLPLEIAELLIELERQ